MMPEIKKFTSLNIERELWFYLQSSDFKMVEATYAISLFFLSDDDCIFVYDLADGVTVKHINCYLNQYWKEYWSFPDKYPFLPPFIVKDLLDNKFLKYSVEHSKQDHQDFFDDMFHAMCLSKLGELE